MTKPSTVQRSLSSRIWYAVSKQVVHAAAALIYKARYTGIENVPLVGGVLIVSNHQSHLDPPMVGCGFPRRVNYLARATLFRFTPFRWLIRSYDAIPIDRDGFALGGIKETLRRLKRGEVVLIFPEGTRCQDGDIGVFKAGFTTIAARSGAYVLPIAIEGAFDVWPRRRSFPGLGTIHVHFGPPIAPRDVKAMDEEELLAETERRVRECHALLRRRPVFARRRRVRPTNHYSAG